MFNIPNTMRHTNRRNRKASGDKRSFGEVVWENGEIMSSRTQIKMVAVDVSET